jgi:hypothetical protein
MSLQDLLDLISTLSHEQQKAVEEFVYILKKKARTPYDFPRSIGRVCP